ATFSARQDRTSKFKGPVPILLGPLRQRSFIMTFADLFEMLDFNRQKTLGLLDNLAKQPNVAEVLGWRPGPGRAHVAWQLMHIAATDDRHVHVRMTGGQPQEAELVRRFAGGSTPDDNIPTLDEIRRYLTTQRTEVLNH